VEAAVVGAEVAGAFVAVAGAAVGLDVAHEANAIETTIKTLTTTNILRDIFSSCKSGSA